MQKLKEIFYPNKKKLLAFSLVLFSSLFILQGVLLKDIITYDEAWPWWQNYLMMFFSFTNFLGSFFQAPYFYFSRFIPNSNYKDIIDATGIILSSYLLGALIGEIWSTSKTKTERRSLILYVVIWILFNLGIFFTFFRPALLSFAILPSAAITSFLVVLTFKKKAYKIFVSLVLLTIIFSIGGLNLTLSNFEDAYCWDKTSSDFATHLKCHEDFNLLEAISQTYKNN